MITTSRLLPCSESDCFYVRKESVFGSPLSLNYMYSTITAQLVYRLSYLSSISHHIQLSQIHDVEYQHMILPKILSILYDP